MSVERTDSALARLDLKRMEHPTSIWRQVYPVLSAATPASVQRSRLPIAGSDLAGTRLQVRELRSRYRVRHGLVAGGRRE